MEGIQTEANQRNLQYLVKLFNTLDKQIVFDTKTLNKSKINLKAGLL